MLPRLQARVQADSQPVQGRPLRRRYQHEHTVWRIHAHYLAPRRSLSPNKVCLQSDCLLPGRPVGPLQINPRGSANRCARAALHSRWKQGKKNPFLEKARASVNQCFSCRNTQGWAYKGPVLRYQFFHMLQRVETANLR